MTNNPYIKDKYLLCFYADGMAHMGRIAYDNVNVAIREGDRRLLSGVKYTQLYLYDTWNDKTVKDWTGWTLRNYCEQ